MNSSDILQQAQDKLESFGIPELKNAGFLNLQDQFYPSVHYPPITMYHPISQEALISNFQPAQGNLFDVYVHIPFCMRQCYFCHYPVKISKSAREKDFYLHMLEKEMDIFLKILGIKKIKTRSILFGGGTPTYLTPQQFDRFLKSFMSRIDSSSQPQFSYDVDPLTLLGKDGEKRLSILKSYGVNRLTIGVQSLDDRILKIMNRPHSAREAVRAIAQAQKSGFKLNIEFIFGYPRQTLNSWTKTISEACKLNVEEIQLYRLKIIPYGDFTGIITRKFKLKPEDFVSFEGSMLMKAIALIILQQHGYHENLTRVFSRAAKDFSLYAHNQCCNLLDQLGFGLTAFSSLHDRFILNTQDFKEYYALIKQGRLPLNRGILRSKDDQLRWAIILPLKNRKVYKKYYQKIAGCSLDTIFRKKIETLAQYRLIAETPQTLELTERGRFFADEVCHQFHHPQYIPFPETAYAEGPLSPYKYQEI